MGRAMTEPASALRRFRSAPADPTDTDTPELQRAAPAARRAATQATARLPRGASAQAVQALTQRTPPDRIGRRLDQFMARMNASYRVGGQTVRVTPHFRSRYFDDQAGKAQQKYLLSIQRAVGPDAFRPIAMNAARAVSSRGQPEDVQVVTQALIDAGALDKYPGVAPDKAIRRLMWDMKLGFDCRGYVARALLYSRGQGNREAAGARYGIRRVADAVFPNDALARVPVAQARPGDVIHLMPPRGETRDHNLILRSNTAVRVSDPSQFTVGGRRVPASFVRAGWPAGATPSVRVFQVDSSWGGGRTGDIGGVERRTWLYNEKTQQWADWDEGGSFRAGAGPYAHPLDGIFRPKSEP